MSVFFDWFFCFFGANGSSIDPEDLIHEMPALTPTNGHPITHGLDGLDVAAHSDFTNPPAPCVNPATGLPMLFGETGVDVAGNPYGCDLSGDVVFSASHDDGWLSGSNSSSDWTSGGGFSEW